MLGYVAAHSESLAMAVIMSKGVSQLAIILSEEQEDHIKAATVWALGQIGGHTPEHAKAIGVSNVLPRSVLQYWTRVTVYSDFSNHTFRARVVKIYK